jgi:hypothetical protein
MERDGEPFRDQDRANIATVRFSLTHERTGSLRSSLCDLVIRDKRRGWHAAPSEVDALESVGALGLRRASLVCCRCGHFFSLVVFAPEQASMAAGASDAVCSDVAEWEADPVVSISKKTSAAGGTALVGDMVRSAIAGLGWDCNGRTPNKPRCR